MGNRRFVSTSDDEDNSPPRRSSIAGEKRNQRKRKTVHISDEDDDDERDMDDVTLSELSKMKKKRAEEPDPVSENDEEEEEEDAEAHPLGEVVRVSGKGRGRRSHYASFEYDGLQYQLEDPVLVAPEEGGQKPYIAIIKDIAQIQEGPLMVTGQWFYRPEEAEKKTGGSWQSSDTRELFYSFHRDEVPAESVLHKCVVHFIPLNKQIPLRKQHPGFIVQKVYDTGLKRLFKLTDKDYEDNKQHEIDLLVQKTLAQLWDLPDREPEEANVENEDQLNSKRLLRKKNVTPLDVNRVDEGPGRFPLVKTETPGRACAGRSEYYAILWSFKALTGETQRDRWLEKLLESIHLCTTVDSNQNDAEECGGYKDRNGSHNKGDTLFGWPDEVVSAMSSLEKAAHDTLSADFQKYNQKMRQLTFNLKSNAALVRRLLNKELEPAQIINMSPNELKEGLTAEELASMQPEESDHLQMTDVTCKRCLQRQVALLGMFQTGHGDRYQLECVPCGNDWFASRDDVAELTIEGPNSAKTVGTAPLATAKFEVVEKNMLMSPKGKGDQRGAGDGFKKATEAHLPVLEKQKSFNIKTEENHSPTATKTM